MAVGHMQRHVLADRNPCQLACISAENIPADGPDATD